MPCVRDALTFGSKCIALTFVLAIVMFERREDCSGGEKILAVGDCAFTMNIE